MELRDSFFSFRKFLLRKRAALGSNGQEKSEGERDLHWMQGVSALDQEKSAMAR
jgi:hypothetical protein